jgi:hypothetical protein
MTSTLTRIRVLAISATIGLFAASAPASSQDPFMAIHMDNQKINSAVSIYWRGLNGAASAPASSRDPFMAIHMDNQKINSAVSRYWRTMSHGIEMDTADSEMGVD